MTTQPHKISRLDRLTACLLSAVALAAIIAATPVTFTFDANGVSAGPSAAFAKDGGDDSDRDRSGRRGGDDDSDRSGRGGGSNDDDDRSGRGGDDDNGDDNGGRRGGNDDFNDDHIGRGGAEHIDPRTGTKVEVSGGGIEIVHPNGWKEELEAGTYEVKDPQGRTVTERRATAEDIARMNAFVR